MPKLGMFFACASQYNRVMPAVASQTRFSTQTITALAEVVTGGSAGDSSPSIGHYRSGPKLERLFGGLNVELRIGNASRVPTVLAVLEHENRQAEGKATIIRIIEACADPRDYLDDELKLTAVVDYMNKRLRFDGYELRKIGQVFKVVALATNTVAAAALKEKAKSLDLDSVHNDFERALTEADSDPADAITAACSTVENVCKCILDEMGKPYPTNKDIKGLVGEVAKHLNLSPARDDLPKEWEQDIRRASRKTHPGRQGRAVPRFRRRARRAAMSTENVVNACGDAVFTICAHRGWVKECSMARVAAIRPRASSDGANRRDTALRRRGRARAVRRLADGRIAVRQAHPREAVQAPSQPSPLRRVGSAVRLLARRSLVNSFLAR